MFILGLNYTTMVLVYPSSRDTIPLTRKFNCSSLTGTCRIIQKFNRSIAVPLLCAVLQIRTVTDTYYVLKVMIP
jgi:hypothetical protein